MTTLRSRCSENSFFDLRASPTSRALAATALSVACCLVFAASALGQTSVWNGGTGFWNDPTNCTGGVPNSPTAVVLIDDGDPFASAVTLNQNATV